MGYNVSDDNRARYQHNLRAAFLSSSDNTGNVHLNNIKGGKAPAKTHPDVSLVDKRRESNNNDGNLNKVPIVICLDATGSMSDSPAIVRNKLIDLQDSLAKNNVPYADVMVMLFNDYNSDGVEYAAVQATQFESDAKIIPQLANLTPVGNGGGNYHEDSGYALWYVLNRTDVNYIGGLDGKKGFIFVITDEKAWNCDRKTLRKMFGSGEFSDTKVEDIVSELLKAWNIFVLRPLEGSYHNSSDISQYWSEMLGVEAVQEQVPMNNICEVIAGTVAGFHGVDLSNDFSDTSVSFVTSMVRAAGSSVGTSSSLTVATNTSNLPPSIRRS